MSTTQNFKLTRKAGPGALPQVCVAGLGTAGVRVMDRIGSHGVQGATFAVLHTNRDMLANTQVQTRIPLGDGDAAAGGCGGDVALGRKSAEQDIEMVRGLISDCQALIVVAGLGGGTATGALPVILQAARGAGVFTAVMLTMPFAFEGGSRQRVAEDGLRMVLPLADFVATVTNDALVGDADKQMDKALDYALEGLAAGVCSLWQILAMPSLLALDQGDLRALHSQEGTACQFSFGMATGADRGKAAVQDLMASFPGATRAMRAGNGLVACVCASHDLTLAEVSEVMDPLHEAVRENGIFRAGVVLHDTWRDRLFLSVFSGDARKKVTAAVRGTASGQQKIKVKVKNAAVNRGAQKEFQLEVTTAQGQGRFGRTKATILDGEDLDIPTYVRRNIKLER